MTKVKISSIVKMKLKGKNGLVLLISLCNSFVLLLLCYLLNNQPLFTGEDLNQYAWMELIKERLGLSEYIDYKDALFINVAYDKQLVDKTDEYGMSVGNVDVTDRNKLFKLLSVIDSLHQQRYVVLDVRFEKGFHSVADSALFAKIASMDNLVIANHEDIELADSILYGKAALSDYASTIVATNFARYKFLNGNRPSIPLVIYNSLTNKTISKHGWLYTCGGKLCYNSLFLRFPTEGFSEYDEKGNKIFFNLGSDLLDNYSAEDLATLIKDKLVFIGNMVEDVHDTYSGSKPGIIITYHALSSLLRGEHYVSFMLLMILAVVFFLISLSLFSEESLIEKIPLFKQSRSKILHFLISLIGYASVLFLMVIVLNLFFDVTISILVPSFYFATQKMIIKYSRTRK